LRLTGFTWFVVVEVVASLLVLSVLDEGALLEELDEAGAV
jgi:hypothetical protein